MRALLVRSVILWSLVAAPGCEPAEPTESPTTTRGIGGEGPAAVASVRDSEVPRAPSWHEMELACSNPSPDYGVLSSLIEQERFGDLEQSFLARQEAYRRDVSCETHLSNQVDWVATASRLRAMQRFVASHPDSWVALSLRGTAWMREGWRHRGGSVASQVGREQWKAMHAAFASAREDLWRSLEIQPDNSIAPAALLEIAKVDGAREEAGRVFSHVLEHDPTNFRAWARALKLEEPRWGGSIDRMEELVRSSVPFSKDNPRLLILPGYVHAVRAGAHARAGRHAEAAEAYRRALRHGSHALWWSYYCGNLFDMGAVDALLSATRQWLEDAPEAAEPHYWQGKAYWKLNRLAEARSAYDRAFSISPGDRRIAGGRGYFLEKNGEETLAVAAYREVLKRHPGNAWTLRRLALLRAGDPDGGTEARQLLLRWRHADPKAPEPLFHLGVLFDREKDPEAEPTLRAYLEFAQRVGDDANRISRAKQILNPVDPARLPGLTLLDLDPKAKL